ncbi:MAG TPA: flagellar export protein FliJ [Clostridia bacterium]|nr:flagellar export protein FliJ [Clostridia bacterium]
MKQFKFRLQQVLEFKRHLEMEQKDQLAVEKIKLDNFLAEETQLRSKFQFWAKRYIEFSYKGISPAQAAEINGFLSELSRMIDQCIKKIQDQEARVETVRQQLVEKMKDRKTLESLADKQSSRFLQEEMLKEEKSVEEIIVGRYHQNAPAF